LRSEFLIFSSSWDQSLGSGRVLEVFRDARQPDDLRLVALEALIDSAPEAVPQAAGEVLNGARTGSTVELRGRVLASLGRLDSPRGAELVLGSYDSIEPELKPRAVDLLTQRVAWGLELLKAIGEGKIPAGSLSPNQVRKLLASRNPELVRQVKER